MKQFFKFMFASMAGFFVSLFVLFLIMMGIISGMMLSLKDDGTVTINDNSILEMKFENEIKERTGNNPLENLNLSGLNPDRTPGLNDILKSISNAKSDDRIKGILLDLSTIDAGLATLE